MLLQQIGFYAPLGYKLETISLHAASNLFGYLAYLSVQTQPKLNVLWVGCQEKYLDSFSHVPDLLSSRKKLRRLCAT